MDVQQLRVFAAAADSVTAATRQLYVGQPALSRQLAALERTLGFRLFTRRPDGMHPTRQGEAFLDRAQQVLASYDALLHEHDHTATTRGDTRDRPVRLGLLDEGFGAHTVPVLRAFRQARPDVDVVVVPVLRPAAQHPLTENRLQVDVLVGDDPAPHDGYQVVEVYRETRVAAVSRRSPLADASTLHVSDLYEEVFCRLDALTAPMRAVFALDTERGHQAQYAKLPCEPEIPALLDRVATGTCVMTFTEGVRAYRHPNVAYIPLQGAAPVAKNVTLAPGAHPQAALLAAIAETVCGQALT